MKKIILVALLSFSAVFSQEKEGIDKGKVRFLITGAFEFGGDELGYVYFTDGSTQSINAGQGVTFSAGADFELTNRKDVFIRTTIGYKFVTTKADNVNIRLTRIPIELTANYNFAKKFWAGTGLVAHTGTKLNFDGLAPNQKYDAALGPIIKLGYGGLGISYTIMKYKDQSGNSFSANSFGIIFAIPLPQKRMEELRVDDWLNIIKNNTPVTRNNNRSSRSILI